MDGFSIVDKLADDLLSGKASSDQFYSIIFKTLPELSMPQHNLLHEKLKNFHTNESDHARYYLFLGMSSIFQGKYENSRNYLEQSLLLFRKLNIQAGIMSSACMLTTVHRTLGRLDLAQQYLQETLRAQEFCTEEKIFDYFNCVTCYQAGELSVQLKNYDAAINYFKGGIQFIGNNPEFEGRILSGLGNVILLTDEWKEAIHHFEKALSVVQKSNNKLMLSKIYADIGNYYVHANDLEKALEYATISLNLRVENKFTNPSITSHIHLAEINYKLGRFSDAIPHAEKAIKLSEELKVNIKLYESHYILSRICEAAGDHADALKHFKKYHELKQEVESMESIKKIEQIQSQYKMDQIEKEKEIVRLRNVELKTAMEEIHESIRYAKRIQNAILPPDATFQHYLPNSFVFYKPKEIVAGDFYFLEKIEKNGMTEIILAACDCTGHGVPGALVSVICSNALNRTIHEYGITDPGKILDSAREMIIHEFEKGGEEVNDGMDVSLLRIRMNKMGISSLDWAGANSPLWLVHNGKLTEFKGNKQPVGKFLKNERFITHSISFEEGDYLYLFSDGFGDQFGGERGKKYTSRKLAEFLEGISNHEMNNQKNDLIECFNQWQGNHEQVDDVLVIGVKI